MLTPDFKICQKRCDEIQFTDITGDYDASTNTGGWGTPNTERADVTSSFLTVEDSNGAIYTVDITADVIAGTTEICIPSSSFGITGDFADGIYVFTWTVSDAVAQYVQCREVFLFCQAKCKVKKLIAGIDSSSCKCDNNSTDRALLAYAMLLGLEYAACCYKIEKFNDLLQAICDISESNCKNC